MEDFGAPEVIEMSKTKGPSGARIEASVAKPKKRFFHLIVVLSLVGVRVDSNFQPFSVTHDRTQNHLGSCSECERDIITT